jgi:hypothetical protein
MPQPLSRPQNQDPTYERTLTENADPRPAREPDTPSSRESQPASLTERASVLTIVSCVAALAFIAVLASGLLNAMVPWK